MFFFGGFVPDCGGVWLVGWIGLLLFFFFSAEDWEVQKELHTDVVEIGVNKLSAHYPNDLVLPQHGHSC